MTMTDKQAYAAMFRFLEEMYQRTGSDELGALLGSMAVLANGSTADPAMFRDWQRAVQYSVSGAEAASLDLEPPVTPEG